MTGRIPKARRELEVLADALATGAVTPQLAARIIREKIMPGLFRLPAIQVTRKKKGPLTQAQKDAITLLSAPKTMAQLDIGNKIGANPARVSEYMNKDRHKRLGIVP